MLYIVVFLIDLKLQLSTILGVFFWVFLAILGLEFRASPLLVRQVLYHLHPLPAPQWQFLVQGNNAFNNTELCGSAFYIFSFSSITVSEKGSLCLSLGNLLYFQLPASDLLWDQESRGLGRI
jgi:hypothetical protein